MSVGQTTGDKSGSRETTSKVTVVAQENAEGRCAKSGNRSRGIKDMILEIDSMRLFFMN